MYKTILVIADQDIDQHAAMQKARAIALDETSRIIVLGFVAPTAGVTDSATARKDEALQKAIDDEFPDFDRIEYDVVVTADIAAYCQSYCQENQVDLVIKTGHRSESLFYTPLDWQLIRELSCTVLITTMEKWRARRNVMVTIDIGSDNPAQQKLNLKVARWARDWANHHDCELHVANCIAVKEVLTELDIISKDEVLAKNERAHAEKLKAFLEANSIKYSSIKLKAGQPDRVLPSLANKLKADLVVIGSVGRKGVKGVLLGNTAEKTLHQLRTDVAVVHPD